MALNCLRSKSIFLFNRLNYTNFIARASKSTLIRKTVFINQNASLWWKHISKRNVYYINDDASEPFAPVLGRYPKTVQQPDEAFENLDDNVHVFIHGGAATPVTLVNSLCNIAKTKKMKNIRAFHIHLEGDIPFTNEEYKGIIRSESLFTGANCRKAIAGGSADYTPIFLSEIPLLFRRKVIELDMALISVSPPDHHGFCSLGVSVDVTRAAIQNAKTIIALVNKHMPKTRGDANIHVSHIDYMYYHDIPLPEIKLDAYSEAETTIGKIIAQNLVEDGATLQTGIGAIPSSVLLQLTGHRNLGVHTEMFSDELVDLVYKGSITNSKKKIRPGVIVSSFVIGTKKVYDFIHDNACVEMRDCAWTNATSIIAQNPKVAAINSCIEIDLTGQVVSDSIGSRIYSGVGGQVDFIRGASLCHDGRGKPIIAICSTTRKGDSKITPTLHAGGGVVTTRGNVHYIVTEYGFVNLFGRNIRQRAYDLITVAHPDHREQLEKAAFKLLNCMPSPD